MLKRKVYDELKKWKERDEHKCLMLRGVRQAGKTSIVDEFGKAEYDFFIEVNFLQSPALKKIFSGDLNVDSLLTNFSIYMPEAVFAEGRTLLFLDEIQECPEAVTSLKFWALDGRFDVIASGSMLGIDYKRPVSYPVGSLQYIDMHPLDFMEFMWAMGIKDDIIDILRECFKDRKMVPEAINSKTLELMKSYLVVGGMPEVVTTFLKNRSLKETDEKQKAILNDYRYDIAHYASPDIKIKAENCFFSLPEQLAKENHKFQYSLVEKGGGTRKFESSIDWLYGAYFIKYCYNVSNMCSPLLSYKDAANFRLYPSDIGLLTAMYDYSLKEQLLENDTGFVLKGAKGGLYEALIADMLIKNGHSELYFRKNEQATFEMEFLLDAKDGAVPVEVKSGNSKSKSLDNALKKSEIPYGYKLIMGNVGVSGKKITLPLYMAMFL